MENNKIVHIYNKRENRYWKCSYNKFIENWSNYNWTIITPKEGDRVKVNSYQGVLILDSIDDMLTRLSGKTHWNTTSEDYLNGNHKTNNGEIYSEDELIYIT